MAFRSKETLRRGEFQAATDLSFVAGVVGEFLDQMAGGKLHRNGTNCAA